MRRPEPEPEQTRQPVGIRTVATNAIKAALAVVALWWVARGVSLSELAATWKAADRGLLAAAIAVFLVTPVLQGVRLRRLLVAQGSAISLSESIWLAFAGNFMNFAVPVGSTSGDVFKAAYLGRRMDDSWTVVVTTFTDRAIGVATLLFTVTGIALAAGPGSVLAPLRAPLVGLSLTILAGVATLRFARLDERTARRFEKLPFSALVSRTADAVRRSLESPRAVGLAILDTLGIQVAAAASFLLIAVALGFRLTPADGLDLYAFFSAGEIVKALPGPPQGFGTLEAAYGLFFREWATTSQIVSAAFAIRVVNLVCSLPGIALAFENRPFLGIDTSRPIWWRRNPRTQAQTSDLGRAAGLVTER